MAKNKRSVSFVIMLALTLAAYVGITVLLAFFDLKFFLASLVITFIIVAFFAFNVVYVRSLLRMLFLGKKEGLTAAQRSALLSMSIPVLVTDSDNNVLWYNQHFMDTFLKHDIVLERVDSVLGGFSPLANLENKITEYSFLGRHYTVYTSIAKQSKDSVYLTYFADDTELFETSAEFKRTRPAVVLLSLDNYDELIKGLRDSEKSSLIAAVDRFMEDFINSTSGVMRKLTPTLYFAVIEEQHLKTIVSDKFKILEAVRSIVSNRVPLTLSVGVGKGAKTLYEDQLFASQALDLALGRGGDQAAVKDGKQFSFFGGTSRDVERRSRIKARTMAAAITNIIKASSNVLITGHKMTDADSIGSAVGVARMARACGVMAHICVDEKSTLADTLIDYLRDNGYKNLFITPQEGKGLVSPNTLLVVTDTQLEQRVDASELVPLVKNLIIIDHHRKAVNHISKSVIFYHDSFASSCSELVCELLQFTEGEAAPTAPEALAMLSGIMLDTKNYTIRTGERTFEMSAHLRRLGAEPIEAKLLFTTSFEVYKSKADIVSRAFVYKGCAISLCENMPQDLRIAVPQAADDMLNIDGINASIVSYNDGDTVHVSARSLGAYNVQLIMERLGGGGHQTMAGVQLPDEGDMDDIRNKIMGAIDSYVEDEGIENTNGDEL